MSSAIKRFEDNATVWVQLGKGRKFAGTVLASSNISTREHGYNLFKVQLEETVTDLTGKKSLHKWAHPRPIQGYKLSRRVESS